ncbi:uncharacterized protein NEMAJ01_0045 [Nematocida major]|uniref:uncharacterized protein n=1 Tax=Nematocida major TaxID=1912982 RepID=UPI00200785E9|nr:uncharacterized protein NEMAJ01_0045 [Nematocida major]KAH9385149.1 hypothetical protein NEMAJ01_0045 [Nematocida major]
MKLAYAVTLLCAVRHVFGSTYCPLSEAMYSSENLERGGVDIDMLKSTCLVDLFKKVDRSRENIACMAEGAPEIMRKMCVEDKLQETLDILKSIQAIKIQIDANLEEKTQCLAKLEKLSLILIDCEAKEKKNRETAPSNSQAAEKPENPFIDVWEVPELDSEPVSDSSTVVRQMQEVEALMEKAIKNGECLEKRKISVVYIAEECVARNTEFLEEATMAMQSQTYYTAFGCQKPPKRKRNTARHILQYKNIYLAQLQNRECFLLSKIVDLFYKKTSSQIQAAQEEMQEKLQELLLYNYSIDENLYAKKIAHFIRCVQPYVGLSGAPDKLALALDAHFLSLLVLDHSMPICRLKEVLSIMHILYEDAPDMSEISLGVFIEYFYDIVRTHLMLSWGNASEAHCQTARLFGNMHALVSSFTKKEEIHLLCNMFGELDKSFARYRRNVTYNGSSDVEEPIRDPTWRYTADKYSIIHQHMSVHDARHAQNDSCLLLGLHPLIYALEEHTIPMWISEGGPNDENTCTVEIGYLNPDDISYRTDLMTYSDACKFTSVKNINIIVDPDLKKEISMVIDKYVHPDATVQLIGVNPNSDCVSMFKSSVLEDVGVLPPSNEDKQAIHDQVLDDSTGYGWEFWPAVCTVTLVAALIDLLSGEDTFFFTIVPIVVSALGVLRALIILEGKDTQISVVLFNIITAGIAIVAGTYLCDILIRASDLTEYLVYIKWLYSALAIIAFAGMLSTYSKKARRRVFGPSYTALNLLKYFFYALAAAASLCIPVFYALDCQDVVFVLLASNMGFLSGIFLYIACSYEKTPTKIKSDQWKRLDRCVMVLSWITVTIGLVLTLVVSIHYDLLENLPIILGDKKMLLSLFKRETAPEHAGMYPFGGDSSALNELIKSAAIGISTSVNRAVGMRVFL